MYNFNLPEDIMALTAKIGKHRDENNPSRLKDYICVAYDSFNPANFKKHPCFEVMNESYEKVMKPAGWRIATANWKEIGMQVIVVSPDGSYYHSKFKHEESEKDVPTVHGEARDADYYKKMIDTLFDAKAPKAWKADAAGTLYLLLSQNEERFGFKTKTVAAYDLKKEFEKKLAVAK